MDEPIVSVLGLAFGAFCVWVAVGVVNRAPIRSGLLAVAAEGIGAITALHSLSLIYRVILFNERSLGDSADDFDSFKLWAAIAALVLGVAAFCFGAWLRRS